MKKLDISIVEPYKAYKRGTSYSLEGDLIVISGINGSGKSQLLQIIAKNSKEKISRNIVQTQDSGNALHLEDILLLSFRDNINLGEDFGQFYVTYKENYAVDAWKYYKDNIMHRHQNSFSDDRRTKKYKDGILAFDDNGIKNPSWRSINKSNRRKIDIIKF